MSRPVDVLASVRRLLAPGGPLLRLRISVEQFLVGDRLRFELFPLRGGQGLLEAVPDVLVC